MIINGFFNYKLDITEVDGFDMSKAMRRINKSNYNIYSVIKAENIIDLFLFDLIPSSISFTEEASRIAEKTNGYLEGIQKGFARALKRGMILQVIVYYPFFRISEFNSAMIYTFITQVNFFNGKKELWISEEIPSYTEYTSSIKAAIKYCNESIDNVRRSTWVDNPIYTYGTLPYTVKYDYLINYNYILKHFIYLNFNLTFEEHSKELTIITIGELQSSINKKIKDDILVDDYEGTFLIGVKFPQSYHKYIRDSFAMLAEFSVLNSLLECLKQLYKIRELDEIDFARRREIEDYLARYQSKYNFSVDIHSILKSSKSAKSFQRLLQLSQLAGAFISNFND